MIMVAEQKRSKRRGAVALSYDQDKDSAPRVSAKGRGLIADKIIAAAAEAGIPVHQDPGLLEMLIKLEIGQDIPGDLYQAVAEVLAYVRRISR